MMSRCKLFQDTIETAVREKLQIKKAFAENPEGGKASKFIDVAGPTATVCISLAGGITLALGVVTFGAASFAGACVAGITLGVKIVDKKVKQYKAKESLKLIQELNVQGYLDCIVMDVAKELSRIFEFQLFELENDEQVEILAKCAAGSMLDLNKDDAFDRNTLIRKVLQDGKISEEKLRTRKDKKWSAPDVFRKPGLRRVIWEKDGAEFKYFVKSSEDSKNKKNACDTSTYGYRGQFLEMKKYPNGQKEDENVKEEADKRDEPREDCCKECFSNDENCTSRRYFVESDIDSKYTKLQLEPYRYDAMHIWIECPQILISFSQLKTSPKPSLADFLKKKLGLPENHLVRPVYRPHSPGKVPDLQKSNLTGSDFSHSDFSGTCLENCDFTKCVMLFTELFGAKMSRAKFCETLISHSNLKAVQAKDCIWVNTLVRSCYVDGARLDSSIGGNRLHETDMSRATIGRREVNHNESKYT